MKEHVCQEDWTIFHFCAAKQACEDASLCSFHWSRVPRVPSAHRSSLNAALLPFTQAGEIFLVQGPLHCREGVLHALQTLQAANAKLRWCRTAVGHEVAIVFGRRDLQKERTKHFMALIVEKIKGHPASQPAQSC